MLLGRPHIRRQVNLATERLANIRQGAQRGLVAGLVAAGLLGSILIVLYGPASFGNYANSKPPVPEENGDEPGPDPAGRASTGVQTGDDASEVEGDTGSMAVSKGDAVALPGLRASRREGASRGQGTSRGTGTPRSAAKKAPAAHPLIQPSSQDGGEVSPVPRGAQRPPRPARTDRAPRTNAAARSQSTAPAGGTDVTVIGGGFRGPARIIVAPGAGRQEVQGGEAEQH
ncbi:MAG: hypothetical protein WD627_10430 [Actinomycetota bacterium]